MRIGLLSDVHANLFALRAAVARLQAEGVDAWVCAGDLVGYGAHPNECVETIAELEPTCVAGNHELMMLEALPVDRAGWLARRSIGWTRGVVRADVRAYLAALPRTATVAGMAVAHGSPGDPEEYVRTDERAAALLSSLSAEQLLVLGHTHRPWLYGVGVGSVFPPAQRELRDRPTCPSRRTGVTW
jgi:predicted phosphodiesterase